MIKCTLRDVWRAGQTLSNLSEARIPVKASYRFSKVLGEFNEVDRKRQELVEKYGERTEDGQLQVPNEQMADFRQEFEELLNEEVEIKIHPVTLDMLENAQLSPVDFMALEPFLDVDEEDEA